MPRMAKTLRRATQREPRDGARFLGDVLAANVVTLRGSFSPRLIHAELAERMAILGHDWKAHTVADLEHGRRTTSVEELAALAIALHATIPVLLDPTLSRGVDSTIDIGGDLDEYLIPGERAQRWLYGRRLFALEPSAGDRWTVIYGEARPPEIPTYTNEANEQLRSDIAEARDRIRQR